MNKIEEKVKTYIKKLRQKSEPEKNWIEFNGYINTNINSICKSLNTRWLISICDTYADYGSPIEARNALIVSVLVNMEKLGQTQRLLQKDSTIDTGKMKYYKNSKPIYLWDGMTSFNINNGDLTKNLFRRMDSLIKYSPEIYMIFKTLIHRLAKEDTILSSLNKIHKKIFKY